MQNFWGAIFFFFLFCDGVRGVSFSVMEPVASKPCFKGWRMAYWSRLFGLFCIQFLHRSCGGIQYQVGGKLLVEQVTAQQFFVAILRSMQFK